MDALMDFLPYVWQLIFLTLGTFFICGFAAWLAERLFLLLVGSGSYRRVVYFSAVIGTPIHELGHAIMCLLFAHKITEMHLLLPPGHPSGTLGYVSHTYRTNNLWAKLGNLFIGIGPIFSGLGVIVLMLVLCFPNQWDAYMETSRALALSGSAAGIEGIAKGVFSLLVSMPAAFSDDPLRAFAGLFIILAVSQHVTLSGSDIKVAVKALPVYLIPVLLAAIIITLLKLQDTVLSALWVFNIWMLSLFAIVIAFSAVWVLIGLIIFGIRRLFQLLR